MKTIYDRRRAAVSGSELATREVRSVNRSSRCMHVMLLDSAQTDGRTVLIFRSAASRRRYTPAGRTVAVPRAVFNRSRPYNYTVSVVRMTLRLRDRVCTRAAFDAQHSIPQYRRVLTPPAPDRLYD